MKDRRTNNCLNCQTPLKNTDNFCPNCGQKNQDNYMSLKVLLGDFFSNYFSFDSRFGRTVKPFFFKPGYITNQFIEGKRIKFANPIRWYLVISLIQFFLLSINSEDDSGSDQSVFKVTNDIDAQDYEKTDSTLIKEYFEAISNDTVYEIPFETITLLGMNDNLTTKEIYDTLKIEEYGTFWQKVIASRFIRLNNSSQKDISGYLLGKLPIIIFFLLPVFAFLLKLFFWKRGLYIKHLIHSLHLHSFLLTMLSLLWLISLLFGLGTNSESSNLENMAIGVFAISSFYVLLSFRNVYKQKILIVLSKLFAIYTLYIFCVAIVLIIGVVISFLLY